MNGDINHMRRALELAAKAKGKTSPNPMVGCVIVNNDTVVGEGWHRAAGEAHAEVEALKAAGEKAQGATAYVSLEPCNHHGRTPPCSLALLEAGVTEVVYALADPNKQAAGGGAFLQDKGVKVRSGVCETEARDLNRYWLHSVKTGRPYIIAKYAMSLDGRIATSTGDSKWITGAKARHRAHELRSETDAILIGAGTVIADNPALTARCDEKILHQPLRIILDSIGRTPPEAAVYSQVGGGALLVTTNRIESSRLEEYQKRGVETLKLSSDSKGQPDVATLPSVLGKYGVCSMMIEGGAKTLGSFFDAKLVDEVWAFVAPVIIGGGKASIDGSGPEMFRDALRLDVLGVEKLDTDFLFRARPRT